MTAEIIHIRERLRGAKEEAERHAGGQIFRIRLCGPDRQWVETVGRFLARAFNLEGFYTALEDPGLVGAVPVTCFLRAGREIVTETGGGQTPGLVVLAGGGKMSAGVLHACTRETLLLLDGEGSAGEDAATPVRLPVAAFGEPDPLGLAAASAGGAARLLGVIRWTALEQALREELSILDPAAVNRHLAMALEAFDRTAPWAGRVSAVWEEVGEEPEPM